MPAKPVRGGRCESRQQDACLVQSPAEHDSGLHETHMQAEYGTCAIMVGVLLADVWFAQAHMLKRVSGA